MCPDLCQSRPVFYQQGKKVTGALTGSHMSWRALVLFPDVEGKWK